MSQATIYLAKLLGLLLLIMGISMVVQRENTLHIWFALVNNVALVYVVGLFTVAAGLAMVLSHNIWRGGVLPVVVTVLCWITLLKGITALVLPIELAQASFAALEYDRLLYLYIVIWLVLGVYLTVEGFRTKAR
jgi:hypothetical protein